MTANWRALLLPFRELKVSLPNGRWRKRNVHHVLTDTEVNDALESYRALPALLADLTNGRAGMSAEIADPQRVLSSVTPDQGNSYWPSPDDVRRELKRFAPRGSYDSIFVLWPQHDDRAGTEIPCRGWGLGMGGSDWTNGATYAVVANASTAAWKNERPGEVWLHEWLHGVCHFFGGRGHIMPEKDADGAELHGYERSPERGWTDYYRDLMNGNVAEHGKLAGIPTHAWDTDHPAMIV